MFCSKMHTLMYCAFTRWLVSPADRAPPGALPCGQHLCMAAKRGCPGRKASVAQSKPLMYRLALGGSVQGTQLISSVSFGMVKKPRAPQRAARSGALWRADSAPELHLCPPGAQAAGPQARQCQCVRARTAPLPSAVLACRSCQMKSAASGKGSTTQGTP